MKDELKSVINEINEHLTVSAAQSLHKNDGYDFLYEDGKMVGFDRRAV
jgi:hypothetical protein